MTSPFDAPPSGGPSALPPPAGGAPAPPPVAPAAPVPTPPAPATPAPATPAAPPPPPDSPTPPATSPADQDLAGLLDRLHDDLELERSPDRAVGEELTDARELTRPQDERVVVETAGGVEFDPTFASFAARAVGYLVDCVVIGVLVAPGVAIAMTGSGAGTIVGGVVAVLGFLLAVVWATRSLASSGRWVGNRLAGTTVVDTRTGRFLAGHDAAARTVARHLLSPILLLGFVPAFFDSQRRTFHDRIATSIVVTKPREVWTAGGD